MEVKIILSNAGHANSMNKINDLKVLSRKVGSDPLQVQAAGGNTSVKIDDTLWIKASGTCLANACDADLFVPVQLTPLLEALDQEDPRAEKSIDFVDQPRNPHGLRPSIETTVHAVLPQKIVVHIHCVDTIAVAIQKNAQSQFEQLLTGFHWLWVPYLRPGLPLSRYISSTMTKGVDVVILGNHGLVVAADTVPLAEALLKRVRAAVKQEAKTTSQPDIDALTTLSEGSEYVPAQEQATHAVAMNTASLMVAAGGSLYPDHVIFLGDGSVVANPQLSVSDNADQNRNENNELPRTMLVPDAGVLMHQSATDSELALARCLADVCVRVPDNAAINYLDASQVYQLLNWEAETYRQSLAKH